MFAFVKCFMVNKSLHLICLNAFGDILNYGWMDIKPGHSPDMKINELVWVLIFFVWLSLHRFLFLFVHSRSVVSLHSFYFFCFIDFNVKFIRPNELPNDYPSSFLPQEIDQPASSSLEVCVFLNE